MTKRKRRGKKTVFADGREFDSVDAAYREYCKEEVISYPTFRQRRKEGKYPFTDIHVSKLRIVLGLSSWQGSFPHKVGQYYYRYSGGIARYALGRCVFGFDGLTFSQVEDFASLDDLKDYFVKNIQEQ